MKRVDFSHFFVDPAAVSGDHFFLEAEEAHHAVRVLRRQIGDLLCAVDGQGNLYEGRIETIEQSRVRVGILSRDHWVGEPRLRLMLAAAPPKGEGFDWVVEKGTELGVAIFQPIVTTRTIIDPQNRLRRWRQKALSAMKQCGRSVLPQVREPVEFVVFCRSLPGASFIAHEEGETPLCKFGGLLSEHTEAVVLIGPEGGFTEQEIDTAKSGGAEVIALGARRLRSETAALTAVVKILTLAGEL